MQLFEGERVKGHRKSLISLALAGILAPLIWWTRYAIVNVAIEWGPPIYHVAYLACGVIASAAAAWFAVEFIAIFLPSNRAGDTSALEATAERSISFPPEVVVNLPVPDGRGGRVLTAPLLSSGRSLAAPLLSREVW